MRHYTTIEELDHRIVIIRLFRIAAAVTQGDGEEARIPDDLAITSVQLVSHAGHLTAEAVADAGRRTAHVETVDLARKTEGQERAVVVRLHAEAINAVHIQDVAAAIETTGREKRKFPSGGCNRRDV